MRMSPPPAPHLQCIKEEGDVEKGEPGVVSPCMCIGAVVIEMLV